MTPVDGRPDEFLPVKPVDLLVLVALGGGERHGYGIVQDIVKLTSGRVTLVPGNLYSVLRRLLDEGLISESSRRPAPDLDDQRRRYYKLTALGKRVVVAEAERMKSLLMSAEVKKLVRELS